MKKVEEKNKINENNKTNIIKLAAVLIVTLAILVSAILIFNNQNSDALKFKKDYESLNGTKRQKDGQTIRSITIPKNNPMVYKEAEEIVGMINNKETFVVYFGFNDCPWCRSVVPTLIETANDLGLDKIYYVDVKEIRDEMIINEEGKAVTSKKGSDGYYELLKSLDNVLDDYSLTDADGNSVIAQEKRIYAPNVVAVVNGKPIKLEEGISDKQTNGYMELTEEMKKDTYKKFRCLIKCVTENNKSCSPKSGC